jgi:crotonobetainyl-CoA:carnitine CoA-transferase CaiB-like acyl-CoA transferase
VLGFDDWKNNPKFDNNRKRTTHRREIGERITGRVREFDFDDITNRLNAAEIPFAPVNSPKDLLDEPHLRYGGYFHSLDVPTYKGLKIPTLPITLGETKRVTIRSGPPRLGEHTDAILTEAGYSAAEIEALKADGVVRRTDQMLQIDSGPDNAPE